MFTVKHFEREIATSREKKDLKTLNDGHKEKEIKVLDDPVLKLLKLNYVYSFPQGLKEFPTMPEQLYP